MKTNKRTKTKATYTHEGAPASRISAMRQLERSVLSCMLWEDGFYESGEQIANRIADLVPKVPTNEVSALAVEAREKMKLRHAPLFLVREMARHDKHRVAVRDTLSQVIQRADELPEFLALYWKDGKQPIAKQVRLGLADAFPKFNEYQLAKYDRDNAVKLRDVLRLVHPVPANKTQARLWKKVLDRTLATPNTWEVRLSAGEDKKAVWTELLREDALGGLALLRNLRNMLQAGVNKALIREALINIKADRVLPFRFISAARHAPEFEPELEQGLFKSIAGKRQLPGKTVVLVDVSGSMSGRVAGRSGVSFMDAACGVAMLARERCEEVGVATFSNNIVVVPPRRGFALRDAIVGSQPHSGTYLGEAVKSVINGTPHIDRLIVITDEQSHDRVDSPTGVEHPYMINIASNKNGVGYGAWTHIDGWSEACLDYIDLYEGLE